MTFQGTKIHSSGAQFMVTKVLRTRFGTIFDKLDAHSDSKVL